MAFEDWFPGALRDFAALILVFLQWLVVSIAVDGAGGDIGPRKVASLYLTISTLVIVFFRLYRSFRWLGKPDAPAESLLGLFSEVVNLTQAWGVSFCAARTWSLPDDNIFHTNKFLHNNADSVFEMGLVQAGVGWAAAYPVTFVERLVAWLAAYVGGVFAMNMFIVSIVLGNRAHWKRDEYTNVPKDSRAPIDAWSVSLK